MIKIKLKHEAFISSCLKEVNLQNINLSFQYIIKKIIVKVLHL